nr:EOG090X0POW [Megafenestra aurita]
MTMDTTMDSARDSNTLPKNQPKRSFDVAFLTGVSETHDHHQISSEEEDEEDLRSSAKKLVADDRHEHKSVASKLHQSASSGSPKSAFKKVSKVNNMNCVTETTRESSGGSSSNLPVDLSLMANGPPSYYHPFSFPAIATTLSLQLLQQNNAAKGLAMSLFSHPAAAAAAAAMAAHQQSFFQQQQHQHQHPSIKSGGGGGGGNGNASNSSNGDCWTPAAAAAAAGLWTCLLLASAPSQNVCAKCNLSFRMTSDLVYHMRSQHRRDASTDPVRQKRQEKLRCPVCGENFRERHHLTRHMTSHEDRELEANVAIVVVSSFYDPETSWRHTSLPRLLWC